ncbi:MAG TPA: DUF350 domain-containing protein [Candidatus Sulfotelmatobacter sp.]|nr:DUF350 domain-containing protein [Candidatus Sulfotelmatobacter sp.]
MKKHLKWLVGAACTGTASPSFAAALGSDGAYTSLGHGMLLGVIYALLGTLLLLLCFKGFDKAITRIDLEGQIEKGNLAAGIFSAAIVLGIAIIIAAAIGG